MPECPVRVRSDRSGSAHRFVRLRSVTHSFVRTGPIDMRVCILIASYEKSDSPLKVPPSVSLFIRVRYDQALLLVLILSVSCAFRCPRRSLHPHSSTTTTYRMWTLHETSLVTTPAVSPLSLSSLALSVFVAHVRQRAPYIP